jgi:hypothetical protein
MTKKYLVSILDISTSVKKKNIFLITNKMTSTYLLSVIIKKYIKKLSIVCVAQKKYTAPYLILLQAELRLQTSKINYFTNTGKTIAEETKYIAI